MNVPVLFIVFDRAKKNIMNIDTNNYKTNTTNQTTTSTSTTNGQWLVDKPQNCEKYTTKVRRITFHCKEGSSHSTGNHEEISFIGPIPGIFFFIALAN